MRELVCSIRCHYGSRRSAGPQRVSPVDPTSAEEVVWATNMLSVSVGVADMVCPTKVMSDVADESPREQQFMIWVVSAALLGLLALRGTVAMFRDVQSFVRRCIRGEVPKPEPLLAEQRQGEPLTSTPSPAIFAGPTTTESQPPPTPQYVVILPRKIMVTTKSGAKYHAITCCEVASSRGRDTDTYTPCSKCEAILKVPLGMNLAT
jgi:hypothetical protein